MLTIQVQRPPVHKRNSVVRRISFCFRLSLFSLWRHNRRHRQRPPPPLCTTAGAPSSSLPPPMGAPTHASTMNQIPLPQVSYTQQYYVAGGQFKRFGGPRRTLKKLAFIPTTRRGGRSSLHRIRRQWQRNGNAEWRRTWVGGRLSRSSSSSLPFLISPASIPLPPPT